MDATSPDFAPGEFLPTRCTPDAEDLSPELHWWNLPEGTVEVAVTCVDPGALSGTFPHWAMWRIDPDYGCLGLGEVPSRARQGVNGFGRLGYTGPEPPRGDAPHQYLFRVHALREPIDLREGAKFDELRAAMHGKVLDSAELVGIYAR